MSAVSVLPPYPIFTDIDGSPLEAGYIWVGTKDQDPQTNPVQLYWDKELTVTADQPIRTIGGYPDRSGSAAMVYSDGDSSIRVTNKNGTVVYSAPSSTLVSAELNATTQPKFDDSTNVATTEFVQNALGSLTGSRTVSGSYNIQPDDAGQLIVTDQVISHTLTLPLISSVPEGAAFHFFVRQGSAIINGNGVNIDDTFNTTSLIGLELGNTVTVVKSDSLWVMSGKQGTRTKYENDTSNASTAFVQAAGNHFVPGGGIGISNLPYQVSSSNAGHWFQIQQTGDVNLPLISENPAGLAVYQFVSVVDANINVNSADTTVFMSTPTGVVTQTYGIKKGDAVTIVSNGDTWFIAQSGFGSDSFVGVIAETGYQQLPFGRIEQWGKVTYSSNSGADPEKDQYFGSATFPITFPNQCFSVIATGSCESDGGLLSSNEGVGHDIIAVASDSFTVTGFNFKTEGGAPYSGIHTFNWRAIGR